MVQTTVTLMTQPEECKKHYGNNGSTRVLTKNQLCSISTSDSTISCEVFFLLKNVFLFPKRPMLISNENIYTYQYLKFAKVFFSFSGRTHFWAIGGGTCQHHKKQYFTIVTSWNSHMGLNLKKTGK